MKVQVEKDELITSGDIACCLLQTWDMTDCEHEDVAFYWRIVDSVMYCECEKNTEDRYICCHRRNYRASHPRSLQTENQIPSMNSGVELRKMESS